MPPRSRGAPFCTWSEARQALGGPSTIVGLRVPRTSLRAPSVQEAIAARLRPTQVDVPNGTVTLAAGARSTSGASPRRRPGRAST